MIEMRKITDFEDFNPKEFCIKPSWWNYEKVDYYNAKDFVEKAKEMAKDVDGICIAIIKDETGEVVIGESCNKGCSSKFLLFNAAICDRLDAEVRVVTYNTGMGALTRFWFDQYIKYKKGFVV